MKKRMTRDEVVSALAVNMLEDYAGSSSLENEDLFINGFRGFGEMSNKELVEEYAETFDEGVEIITDDEDRQKMIDLLQEYRGLIAKMSDQWDRLAGEAYFAGSDGYPFENSYDEEVIRQRDWADTFIEKLLVL